MDESGCRDWLLEMDGERWAGEGTYERTAVLPLMRRQPRLLLALASIFGSRKASAFRALFLKITWPIRNARSFDVLQAMLR